MGRAITGCPGRAFTCNCHNSKSAFCLAARCSPSAFCLATSAVCLARCCSPNQIYRKPEDRKSQISLFYTDDGKPCLFFNDQNGTSRFGVLLDQGGRPRLSLQDENRDTIFSQGQ